MVNYQNLFEPIGPKCKKCGSFYAGTLQDAVKQNGLCGWCYCSEMMKPKPPEWWSDWDKYHF